MIEIQEKNNEFLKNIPSLFWKIEIKNYLA